MDYTCFDYVTVGICIIKNDFTIVCWNRRLEERTGEQREKVLGRKLYDLFPHFSEEKYKQRIQGLFNGGPPVILSSQLHKELFFARTVTGKKSVQKATVSALPDTQGGYNAIFSIKDITELSGKITLYRKMRDTAQKIAEEKEVLFREMHHRIKNNIQMISSLVGLKAVFSIDFREVTYDNHYVIVFSNSGRPIPENVGLDNPDTLGLRLITLLTEQLKGTIDLQRSPRPEFTLSFPLD
jgi:PAS domain S-box-containing protein